jgi:hypothetical protein
VASQVHPIRSARSWRGVAHAVGTIG